MKLHENFKINIIIIFSLRNKELIDPDLLLYNFASMSLLLTILLIAVSRHASNKCLNSEYFVVIVEYKMKLFHHSK